MRARWGGIGLILLGIVAGLAVLAAATPIGRYFARGAYEEAKILARRQSIAKLVADSTTPADIRAKLRLVLEARRFAVDSLGLPAKDAFTQFTRLDHDTLVLVLSGAYRDRLQPVTWWFPVVGRVPYKGYFDFEEAKHAERDMRDAGFDTYLRPSPAFSTLGFFNDPLLSTTLGEDSLAIVNTVIHELTHNKYYARGQAVFNESFASFVGARGSGRFYASRGDTASARRAAERWSDELLLGAVWQGTFAALDSAYSLHANDSARAARLAARDTIYAHTRRLLVDSVAPRLKSIDPRYAERARLDNAALLARRIYSTGLDAFEAVLADERGDVRRALERIIAENKAVKR
ncbi:MAG TPA: aminopeptidase [Gemmatimonadaceae bacterium]|nr:aminopeptidase [Gemmatimonadaceae bacterium]